MPLGGLLLVVLLPRWRLVMAVVCVTITLKPT